MSKEQIQVSLEELKEMIAGLNAAFSGSGTGLRLRPSGSFVFGNLGIKLGYEAAGCEGGCTGCSGCDGCSGCSHTLSSAIDVPGENVSNPSPFDYVNELAERIAAALKR